MPLAGVVSVPGAAPPPELAIIDVLTSSALLLIPDESRLQRTSAASICRHVARLRDPFFHRRVFLLRA